ncbi:MAG: hypothetical protein HRT72_09860 [Flavobacteriales bacterium]|nr:hypothetical protein [Flavobacteriales bacterium]
MKPIGYLFNGRFYKLQNGFRGRTMSENNKPTPIYSEEQMIQVKLKRSTISEDEIREKISDIVWVMRKQKTGGLIAVLTAEEYIYIENELIDLIKELPTLQNCAND